MKTKFILFVIYLALADFSNISESKYIPTDTFSAHENDKTLSKTNFGEVKSQKVLLLKDKLSKKLNLKSDEMKEGKSIPKSKLSPKEDQDNASHKTLKSLNSNDVTAATTNKSNK